MKYKYFIYLGIISCLSLTGCKEQNKKEKISSALSDRVEKNMQKRNEIKNDKEPPVITCEHQNQTYEVNQSIDIERIKMSLSAIDNIDGDITDRISISSSNIQPYEEGTYEILYSVIDSAGNQCEYPITITLVSKYEENEKTRYMTAYKAYKKLYEDNEILDINLYNIIITETGNIAALHYSGKSKSNEYIHNQYIYNVDTGESKTLSDETPLPSEFNGKTYELNEYDLEDFAKYYHLDLDKK